MRAAAVDNLRVIFAGGGTGGHIMPGAAVAQALRELLPGTRCLFLSTARSSERQCREAIAGFELARIPAARWRGMLQKFRFAITSVGAAQRSLEIIRAFRPHAVVGLGGYSCAAPVLVARALRVPTMLFESNAVPGRAVRALAPLVDCVQLQWQAAARLLRARRLLVSGNPVRPHIMGGDKLSARIRLGLHPDRCTLLAMGGSQGALALNRALHAALRYLTSGQGRLLPNGLQVLHLIGPEHLAEAPCDGSLPGLVYRARGYMTRMQDAYSAADFVLARAGGSTLAELTATGLPSILVPYPHATENHQAANAAVLAQAGAAVVFSQRRFSAPKLGGLIADLANHPERRIKMAACARTLGRPDAANVVAEALASMAGFDIPCSQDATIRESRRTTESLSALQAA